MKTSVLRSIEDQVERALYTMGVPYNYLKKTSADLEGLKTAVSTIAKALDAGQNLFLQGGVGCGKTHIMAGIARKQIVKHWGKIPLNGFKFITVPELYLELKDSINGSSSLSIKEVVDYYSELEFLFLDDLGAENITDFSKEMLYIIINNRFTNSGAGLTTYISSNADLKEVSDILGVRIASRIVEHCLIIKIKKADHRPKLSPKIKGE